MADKRSLNIINEGSAVVIDGSTVYVYGGLEKATSGSDSAIGGSSNDGTVVPTGTLKECTIGKDAVKVLSSLDEPKAFSTLTRIGNKLYLIFGFHPDTGWSEDVHMYDLDSNEWTLLDLDEDADDIPGARDKHNAVAVGEEIYVFGGFGPMDDEENEEEGDEPRLATITESEPKSSGAPSGDNAEGANEEEDEEEDVGPSALFSWFNELWILKPNGGVANWSQPLFSTAARPTPRAASSLTLDRSGNRLINFGGRDFTGRRNDVNVFDLAARKWLLDVAEGSKLPPERSYHAACVHKDNLIICGGRDSGDKELGDIFLLHLDSFIFEEVSLTESLRFLPRCCHAVGVVQDELVILGGVSGYDKEKMLCGNRVEEVATIAWASLISAEVEPTAKKPRVSNGKDAGDVTC